MAPLPIIQRCPVDSISVPGFKQSQTISASDGEQKESEPPQWRALRSIHGLAQGLTVVMMRVGSPSTQLEHLHPGSDGYCWLLQGSDMLNTAR